MLSWSQKLVCSNGFFVRSFSRLLLVERSKLANGFPSFADLGNEEIANFLFPEVSAIGKYFRSLLS